MDLLKDTKWVLALVGLVVAGIFLLAALGRMDPQLAVGSAVSFVSGVLVAWKRGVAAPSARDALSDAQDGS